VSGWKPGDEVVAYPGGAQGAYAEYLVVPVTELARKPAALTFTQAAAYPLVALTAWNAVEAARPVAGETVLVHGGAGGVGAFVVQFAKLRGARVIATASARNLEFVRGLGADQAVDYRATRFEDVARDVDAVIDTVGGETLARSPAVVKRGGRLVTIAGRVPEDACRARELACAWSNADNAPGRLGEITNLIALGKVRVFVDRTFPLAEAAAAQEANRMGGGRGKIVIVVKDEAHR
jgi:NADPH:quinone reductase-like Zn-dependent oxidoreductase